MEHFDVVVVGAGISGIGAGFHLQDKCPDRSYVILEGRDDLGGTWDLFRYPGIRSDSDMYTMGYGFKPWTNPQSIADGPRIISYLNETVDEFGLRDRIRFGHYVKAAAWNSNTATWTVDVERKNSGETIQFTCNFLFMCSGYYNYEHGYEPEFEGADTFNGTVVHPQKWSEDIDYAGKKVVVIGSGATAVTVVPEMARTAEHVTMLQRSPTYMAWRPGGDVMAQRLYRLLPDKLASHLIRWRNILMGMVFFRMCRKNPERVRKMLLDSVREQLPEGFDVEKHFTPTYNPWDQRLCLVRDGDLFQAINWGKASVVTDHIRRFTPTGIELESGDTLEADIIVTATGLDMQLMSGIGLSVDGEQIEPADTLSYKGMMFSNLPNLATCFGYTNASWTLKCDLTCKYVCKLLNYMRKEGYEQCTPRPAADEAATEPFIDFSSGYVQRGVARFPRQGKRKPWKVFQNYLLDKMALDFSSVDDGVMEFSRPDRSNPGNVDTGAQERAVAESA